jgi:hypothetical protein
LIRADLADFARFPRILVGTSLDYEKVEPPVVSGVRQHNRQALASPHFARSKVDGRRLNFPN